ncbi:MAG: peptide chain release factor 1 [Candidatus Omnitrophica bacterium]|nr:peptide chain release factor 1 [Candidatus Omnitrophota bacterium]
MLVEQLRKIASRARELETKLAEPDLFKDRPKYQAYSKELARLRPMVEGFSEYENVAKELADVEALLRDKTKDEELLALYREEQSKLLTKRRELETFLEGKLLAGTDPNLDKNIIVEVRAGTGGEEAALFARDLFRMYTRFAAQYGLAIEVINTNPSGKGGLKEVIFGVSGGGAYEKFRFESGTHRVQRVPETEASGRIHTSAATVAVLPEANEVEVNLKPEDLRIEVCRSGGPGGQGVNTTDSAVQIFHIPTGMIVRCQDERSQLKNKTKALRVLRARLLEMEQEKQSREISENRKKQVGSGDRSQKIRTYNFPDNRVTDHRINFTLHSLSDILDGHLEELIEALAKEDRLRKLGAL